MWLDRRITVDPTLIHRITRLSMQGSDLQEFYPGKVANRTLAQRIKDTYGDVENRMRDYKVPSIWNGTVRLACQLIAGKIVRKNIPTQVTGFIVDLAGKCVEGLQMNWEKYLVNQLELVSVKPRIRAMISTLASSLSSSHLHLGRCRKVRPSPTLSHLNRSL
jgi:hypothetical protein